MIFYHSIIEKRLFVLKKIHIFVTGNKHEFFGYYSPSGEEKKLFMNIMITNSFEIWKEIQELNEHIGYGWTRSGWERPGP